ncbi:major facilitator superfamily domain-containing protein [Flagelloscypha sp. PMI_526]|nr:major facilitator superfamily domain-containing protein [Flagelloscypha sp. PMI_526]
MTTEHSTSHSMNDLESPRGNPTYPVERPTRRFQALLLFAGFVMIFTCIGFNQSFGIFQEYYTSPESPILDARGRDALVSVIGSLGGGLTWSGGILVNPLLERATSRQVKWIAASGTVLLSLGLLGASFATRVWHLYLTQGLMYGLGSATYYFPFMALTPLFFDQNRGFAMGIVLAGAGVGGLTIAPVLRLLITKYGVSWALRIFSGFSLSTGLLMCTIIRKREGLARNARTRVDSGLAKRGTFIFQSLAAFLQAGGQVIPQFYMASYSISILHYPLTTASLFISIYSGVNSLSRVIMGALADRLGRQNTLIFGVACSAISVLGLWYNAPRDRFISFVVFYGIYAGGYNALLPTTIAEVYGDRNYSSVNGFVQFVRGLGNFAAAPIAGTILGTYARGQGAAQRNVDGLQAKYNYVVIYNGLLLVAATACVLQVRWLHAKEKGEWKWKA